MDSAAAGPPSQVNMVIENGGSIMGDAALKLLWVLVVVLLPVLGLILWFFLGPRDGRS